MKDILFDLTRMSKSRMDTTAAQVFAGDDTYLQQAEADADPVPARSARERRLERRWAVQAWFRRRFGREPKKGR